MTKHTVFPANRYAYSFHMKTAKGCKDLPDSMFPLTYNLPFFKKRVNKLFLDIALTTYDFISTFQRVESHSSTFQSKKKQPLQYFFYCPQVYVTEIAVPEIRGCLSSVLKILSQIGILISFSLGASLNWHQLALVVAAAPVLLFFALLFIPETPSSLLLRDKDEEAASALQWLRGPDADIRQELATIRTNILASKHYNDGKAGKFKVLLSKRLTRPVLITCGLMFFQRFTGAHVFNFYAVPMFKKTFRMMNPHGGAIATSVVQLLASCLSGLLIDHVGRLPLLMTSGVMMSIALAGFGSYAYYEDVFRNSTDLTQVEPGSYDWIPLLCVLTFTIAFSLGISPISSLLIGELFPLEYRSTGSALATSFSHLCGFVNVKTAADFQDHIGLYGLFWLYAGISVLCLLFVVLFVPETKGREIDEMDPKYVESLCINR
nr:facilitated trehalose transporter Tret1-like [Danaus plexippus plexippus]